MFDQRLLQVCPKSKKYMAGNILCQWLELILNALMMLIVAQTAGRLYQREWGVGQLWLPAALILGTVAIRFFCRSAGGADELSGLAHCQADDAGENLCQAP